ncbi:hypothetical protein C0J50_22627 [Silurus asotus]|uniref:Uncharacterized protein n=1 Tax=Silurus asotus TaxID=30991 RepID=A0AAD5AJR8_SILAS|nr:hypothetical protein C0J50_22627 [Silurus asotus]
MSSQVTMSSSIPTSNSYFQASLMDLLTEKENPQVPPQRHDPSPVSCLEARFATQSQTLSHITTKAISTQSTVSGSYSSVPAKSKESRSSKNQLNLDVQSSEGLWQESNSETTLQRNDGPKSSDGLEEAQHTKNVAKHQELFAAWQKVVLQSHKAVAVVPPISQQVPSPDMNIESIPFKTDQVSGKIVESNAPSLPKHKNESTVDTIIPEIQSTGVAQSNISSQNSVCSTASTSKSPGDHSEGNGAKSNGDLFHLSEVRVGTFTQNSFLCLLKHFENTKGTLKKPVADLEKCLLDLYWGGGKRNVLKRAQTFLGEYINLLSALSTKEIETAVFQYLQHKDLIKLAPHYHILKDDTILPTDEFRSSWLNLDGQPADIEKMLAEPVIDFNLPSYAVQEGFNTLDLNSEPTTSTDCQNDDKEISNVMVCESESTDKITNKQGDESLEDHQVQSRSLEQSFQSDEITDPLNESIMEAECEQVCRDAGKQTSSSFEMIEQGDLSIDFDFSKDPQTFQHLLLSSDADETSLKGCNLKKESSHLCQVEIPEVSGTPDNGANAFSSSANRIKFTCPHVTENDLDSEPFCSRCWEETPLLDLDLEEALFSPEPRTTEVQSFEGIVSEPGDATESCSSLGDESAVKCTESVHITMPIEEQVCETNSSVAPELPEAPSPAPNIKTPVVPEQPQTQSGDISPLCNKSKPTKTAEDAFCTTDIEAVKTSSPKPHPNGQNIEDEPTEKGELRKSSIKWKTQMNAPSSPSDKQDPNGNEWSSSNYSSTSTCESNIRKPDCSPDASEPIEANMTKSSSGKVSPPKYPQKKIKVFKTVSVPTLDELFTPDIVVKKASAPKPHSDDLSVSSTKDDQGCKDKRVKRGENKSPITLKKQGSGQTNEDTCQKQTPVKFQVLNGTPRKNAGPNQDKTGQNKATKKLALYGLHKSNRKRREVHHHQCFNRVTLSTAPAYITLSNSPKSTKSYTDTPSAKQKVYDEWSSKFFPDTKKKRKKQQKKSEKVELKSRIQALKRNLVEKQFIDMLEDFDAGPKAKKIKFKRAIFEELF